MAPIVEEQNRVVVTAAFAFTELKMLWSLCLQNDSGAYLRYANHCRVPKTIAEKQQL